MKNILKNFQFQEVEIKSFPLLTKISRTENQKVSNPRRTTNRKKKQPIFHEDSTLLSLKIEKRRHTVYTVSLRSKCFSDGSLDRSSSPRSTGRHRDSLSNLENGGCGRRKFGIQLPYRTQAYLNRYLPPLPTFCTGLLPLLTLSPPLLASISKGSLLFCIIEMGWKCVAERSRIH